MLRRAAAVVAALVVLVPAVPARARAGCPTLPVPGEVSTVQSYEARLYDLDRLAPLATGAGIRVAVVDSGVDAGHPQLTGAVAAGRDLLRGDPSARQDCVGHGTGVASIIAARPVAGVPFHGLAPGVTVVPVRITEKQQIGGEEPGDDAGPEEFAEAIEWAADPGRGDADVINLSVVMTGDDARVRRAVVDAVEAGVVVVAAAGNNGRADQGNATPYPAAYPGVIGVGAVTAAGVRADFSQRGEYVDLAAAGDAVTMAAAGGGHTAQSGTSYAAPFVSATAALLLQRFPGSSPAEVTRRLTATADPAPGGSRSDDYGFGLLNPYRALTETLGPRIQASPAPVANLADDPSAIALRERRASSQDTALLVAAAGLGVVLLLGLGAVVLRRGRRRGWRPADRS
jgi:type VII secretion-associated serine protease mycosin